MLKNIKVVLFVILKSWSGRKLLDPTTYHSVRPVEKNAVEQHVPVKVGTTGLRRWYFSGHGGRTYSVLPLRLFIDQQIVIF